jgi:hypothetical protein
VAAAAAATTPATRTSNTREHAPSHIG